MSATTSQTTLPGLPRKPLAENEQLEAVRRAQSQAEQRVKLGMQLFKAAEAHTTQRRSLLDQIKAEQRALRDELQLEMAESLQRYEHRIEGFDDKLTKTIDTLEQRIVQLQNEFAAAENRIETLLARAESLMNEPTDPAKDKPAEQPPQIFTQVIRRLDERGAGNGQLPPEPST